MPSRGDGGCRLGGGSPRRNGELGLSDEKAWKRLDRLDRYGEDRRPPKPYSEFPTLGDGVAFVEKNGGHFDGDAGAVVPAPEPERAAATGDSGAETGDSSAEFCPLLRRECLRDACAWYVVEGTRGECAVPYFARWFESFCAHRPGAGGER